MLQFPGMVSWKQPTKSSGISCPATKVLLNVRREREKEKKKGGVHTIPQNLDTYPEISTPNRFEEQKQEVNGIYQGGKKKLTNTTKNLIIHYCAQKC